MAEPIRVEGLAEVRKTFRRSGHAEQSREVTRGLREGAELVPPVARPLLRSRTGRMASMYRVGTAGNTAFIRNRHPGAGVQEFGGVIRPKGTPITIRPQKAVTRAMEQKSEAIAEKVGDALDDFFQRAGWR